MGTLQFAVSEMGQVGVIPRTIKIATTDSYATITAAGYLNQLSSQGLTIAETDLIIASYGDAQIGFFTPSISGGSITLNPATGGEVTLPVTDGHLAIFDGTDGTIEDGGVKGTAAAKAASDNTKATLASVAAATVANNLLKAADIAGTVIDAGFRTISGTTTTYAGGGTSNAFTVAGLTATCVGTPVIRTSTNAVAIAKAIPSTNTLTVTFTADPGASTTVDYNYTTAPTT